jgi:hypothetical protein
LIEHYDKNIPQPNRGIPASCGLGFKTFGDAGVAGLDPAMGLLGNLL